MKNLNSKEQTKLALTDKLSHFFGVSVEDATYDIIVCSDPELKNVVYHKEGIVNSFYNFETIFETDRLARARARALMKG